MTENKCQGELNHPCYLGYKGEVGYKNPIDFYAVVSNQLRL